MGQGRTAACKLVFDTIQEKDDDEEASKEIEEEAPQLDVVHPTVAMDQGMLEDHIVEVVKEECMEESLSTNAGVEVSATMKEGMEGQVIREIVVDVHQTLGDGPQTDTFHEHIAELPREGKLVEVLAEEVPGEKLPSEKAHVCDKNVVAVHDALVEEPVHVQVHGPEEAEVCEEGDVCASLERQVKAVRLRPDA